MENKRVELLVERSTKHGQAGRETRSRTYLIWQSMIGRCHRPSDSSYKYYGAKGVTVCDRWRKFEDFFSDMGTAPDGMHIHRANGATVYSKETCQWMNEGEHIGLHNKEQGWGARMTRAQLIDALTGAKQELAYERELNKALPKAVDELREQLAAERERYSDMKTCAEVNGQLTDQLREQLAAEQAKFVAQREDWIKEIQQLQDQLAAARENTKTWAIEAHDSAKENQQLREQLAAEREKLVDALKANMNCDKGCYKLGEAALAQAKEGK